MTVYDFDAERLARRDVWASACSFEARPTSAVPCGVPADYMLTRDGIEVPACGPHWAAGGGRMHLRAIAAFNEKAIAAENFAAVIKEGDNEDGTP